MFSFSITQDEKAPIKEENGKPIFTALTVNKDTITQYVTEITPSLTNCIRQYEATIPVRFVRQRDSDHRQYHHNNTTQFNAELKIEHFHAKYKTSINSKEFSKYLTMMKTCKGAQQSDGKPFISTKIQKDMLKTFDEYQTAILSDYASSNSEKYRSAKKMPSVAEHSRCVLSGFSECTVEPKAEPFNTNVAAPFVFEPKSLDSSTIAGTVIGSIAVTGLLIYGMFSSCKRSKTKQPNEDQTATAKLHR